MKYVNVKTGAVVGTACIIKGGNWKVVEEQPKETAKKRTVKANKKKSGE